jgi:hypothetical protein
MDGYAARAQPSEGIHDSLFCRVIVIKDGSHTAALVSCDLCWITANIVQQVRMGATSKGVDKVLLSATHNHSGPAIADFLAPPTKAGAEYVLNLPAVILGAIVSAMGNLQPCTAALGRGRSHISTNRRAKSEVDSEVMTLLLTNGDGKPIAGFLNYACHPTVLGQENRLISSDLPGRAAELVEEQFGGGFVCLYINGACGDVNPRTCRGYDCHGTFDDVNGLAKELVESSIKSPTSLLSDSEIRFANSTLGPFGPFGLQFEVEVIGLGDVLILAIPAEVFASTGLWLKKKADSSHLVIASYTNGYCGYVPTEDAFERNDDEARWVCWVDRRAEADTRTACAALIKTMTQRR